MKEFSTAQVLSVITDYHFFCSVDDLSKIVAYTTGADVPKPRAIRLARAVLLKQPGRFGEMQIDTSGVQDGNRQRYLDLLMKDFGATQKVKPASELRFTHQELSELAQNVGVPQSRVLTEGNSLTFAKIVALVK